MNIKIYNYNKTKDVYYTVKDGDTLDAIAQNLKVSKSYILEHNSSSFYVGKILYLPETDFKTYTVKPFDSLEKIARDNNTTVEYLKQKNQLTDNYLFVGQKIFL